MTGSRAGARRAQVRGSGVRLAAIGFVVVGASSPAFAQSTVAARWELGVAGLFVGRTTTESASADLIEPGGGLLPLFRTNSELAAGSGLEVRVGARIAGRLTAEAVGAWSRAEARARVSDDADGAAGVTLVEPLMRVSVEGAAVWTLATRGRAAFVARAAAGWMREVASAGSVVADGVIGNVGAGMKYWWRPPRSGQGRALGFSAEVRALVRSGGISLGTGGVRVSPAASAGLLIGF